MKSGATLLLKMAIVVGFFLVLQQPCGAQQTGNGIDWEKGPAIGKLGEIAQILVPKGYRFTGKTGTQRLLELTQNPSSGDELGALVPILDK